MWRVFFYFCKAFDTVSHSILLDYMFSIQLDKSIKCWVNSWLMSQAQELYKTESHQAGSQSLVGFPRAQFRASAL